MAGAPLAAGDSPGSSESDSVERLIHNLGKTGSPAARDRRQKAVDPETQLAAAVTPDPDQPPTMVGQGEALWQVPAIGDLIDESEIIELSEANLHGEAPSAPNAAARRQSDQPIVAPTRIIRPGPGR
jgi:hypothetical protein